MHFSEEIYKARFDFQDRYCEPSMTYMLAATPRSGSTFFSLELWRSGLLGAPLEYLNEPFLQYFKSRVDTNDQCLYWSFLKQKRTSPNGLFGFKMFMLNYYQLKDRKPNLLQLLTPNKVLFLRRRDEIQQAISYSKAIQTNGWFSDTGCREAKYDLDHINECVAKIRLQHSFWEAIFELTNVPVQIVYYEDLLENLHRTIDAAAEFLGVRLNGYFNLPLPITNVQRDEVSKVWRKRYTNESNVEGTCTTSL